MGRFLRGAAQGAEGPVGSTVLRAGDSEVGAWPSAYPQKTDSGWLSPQPGPFPLCTQGTSEAWSPGRVALAVVLRARLPPSTWHAPPAGHREAG